MEELDVAYHKLDQYLGDPDVPPNQSTIRKQNPFMVHLRNNRSNPTNHHYLYHCQSMETLLPTHKNIRRLSKARNVKQNVLKDTAKTQTQLREPTAEEQRIE